MKVLTISTTRINPAPYNPRKDLKPGDPEYEELLHSIEQFGCVEPLVWNRRTGNLVGGHQRFKVLVARGAKKVQVSVLDLPTDKEKALNLALNRISGRWDQAKLDELLGELASLPEFDVELTGFDPPEIELAVGKTGPEDGAGEDDFDVDLGLAQAATPVTEPGDLIELGPHRLLCADAAKTADLERLLGDEHAHLLSTDPPYNVNYTGANRPVSPKSNSKKNAAPWQGIAGDRMDPRRYRAWFRRVIENVDAVLFRGASFYVWNSHKHFGLMHDVMTETGLQGSCVITWAKESFAPGFGDYNEQTEFCLYGWKRSSAPGPPTPAASWASVLRPRDRPGFL